jgi:glycosyltransferase involved in cell wall biosynthesis
MSTYVVQLATGHVGGAGLAARRLHQQLLCEGVESDFYCLERENFTPSQREYSIKRNFVRRIQSKLAILVNENLTKQTHFSVFSTNAVGINFFKKLSENKTRVLHFHNWQNLISQKALLRLVAEGFPVVLTLHDERIATGGCHYRLDCTQNKINCKDCPRASKLLSQKIRRNRKNLLSSIAGNPKNFLLISPSMWLKNSVHESLNLNPKLTHIILNPIGPDWNVEKFIFNRIGRTNEKLRVGVATMSDTFVKYGDLLKNIVNHPEFTEKYEIVYLRDYPQSESKLSLFWKEIDVLLALSRADNSPNSIVEARSLGIPVLTSNIGGIPELLGEYDIALAREEHTIKDVIKSLSEIRKNINHARRNDFDSEINSSHKFIELYESLLNNS